MDMASIASGVVEPAEMAILTSIRYAVSCKDNVDSLKRQANRLQSRLKDKKKELEEAEREDQTATYEFEDWEENVKKIQGEEKEMKDEFESMTTCIGACTPNIVSRAILSRRAEQLLQWAKELYENIPQISHKSNPDRFEESRSTRLMGRESVLEQLDQLVHGCTKNTIGIYGMAGVGKTEVLNKFYRDFHKKNPEYNMFWVDLEGCHSVEDAQRAISQKLHLRWIEDDKPKARANRIHWFLNKKSFILILDDVWSAVNLTDVGIPTEQQGKSKVILATQGEDICDTMEAEKVRIKCLDWEVAWCLFEEKVGKEVIESDEPEIRHQAEILVRKCGGLPLALVNIGRAMATKKTPDLWKHAVTSLENTPQEIKGV